MMVSELFSICCISPVEPKALRSSVDPQTKLLNYMIATLSHKQVDLHNCYVTYKKNKGMTV